jgi:hypothetical protein
VRQCPARHQPAAPGCAGGSGGEHAATCLLFGPKHAARLRALERDTDGFELAQLDLELRGEGEIAGTRQSGLAQLRFAQLPADEPLAEAAKVYAESLLGTDPELVGPEHALLGDALAQAYGAGELARCRCERERDVRFASPREAIASSKGISEGVSSCGCRPLCRGRRSDGERGALMFTANRNPPRSWWRGVRTGAMARNEAEREMGRVHRYPRDDDYDGYEMDRR